MRPLPDPDISLRDACDFITNSSLGRRALTAPAPANLAVLVRDLVDAIYRLTISCHLSEFTDHGLGHLCSLVDRLSRWTSLSPQGSTIAVVDSGLSPEEASILLLATLVHDIGMLSQRIEDMPIIPGKQPSRPLSDLSGWVRRTHIHRLENLTRFLFEGSDHSSLMENSVVQRAFKVAKAHGEWPWEWTAYNFESRDSGLAAMLAVADLLDEDSLRCDSETLLRHRIGTSLNRAHWIRHGLTSSRVLVSNGVIRAQLSIPPNTGTGFEVVLSALRNHYRLVRLYREKLHSVAADINTLEFDPESGLPPRQVDDLGGWSILEGFETEGAMIYHLLSSFMPEALADGIRLSSVTLGHLQHAQLETIDLARFYTVRNTLTPRTPAEENFHALLTP
jgi:hypothetical protein